VAQPAKPKAKRARHSPKGDDGPIDFTPFRFFDSLL
jgi:hypothetical protein